MTLITVDRDELLQVFAQYAHSTAEHHGEPLADEIIRAVRRLERDETGEPKYVPHGEAVVLLRTVAR